MNKHLHEKKCVPCEGGTKPMEGEGVQKYLRLISGWDVQGGIKIVKEFSFDDFEHALAFVNAIGRIAEGEGHLEFKNLKPLFENSESALR